MLRRGAQGSEVELHAGHPGGEPEVVAVGGPELRVGAEVRRGADVTVFRDRIGVVDEIELEVRRLGE
eukprot:10681799-Alexandrium_andersonii.AAC.1